MKDKLTNKDFWFRYWKNKPNLVREIPEKDSLKSVFQHLLLDTKIKESIEIGGYPGYYSIYLTKYLKLKTTLLDYVVDKSIIKELLKANGLKDEQLKVIEADLFKYETNPTYDFCFSLGFVEHFSDTKNLIERHVGFLKPGGTLFILVPNFLGLNGWLNKKFDRYLYDTHYLNCMDPKLLKQCAEDLELKNIKSQYYGTFSIWLGNIEEKSSLFRTGFKAIWFIGKIIGKILPFQSKQFSPYTILTAEK